MPHNDNDVQVCWRYQLRNMRLAGIPPVPLASRTGSKPVRSQAALRTTRFDKHPSPNMLLFGVAAWTPRDARDVIPSGRCLHLVLGEVAARGEAHVVKHPGARLGCSALRGEGWSPLCTQKPLRSRDPKERHSPGYLGLPGLSISKAEARHNPNQVAKALKRRAAIRMLMNTSAFTLRFCCILRCMRTGSKRSQS